MSSVRRVRDLGIFIDAASLTWRCVPKSLRQTCSKCFAALRQLRSICRSLSNDVMQSLIVALVFSRLDYGSVTFAGLPKQLMDRLQSVQNAAAWLIFKALLSGPHLAITAQITLASDARTCFILAGSASVSMPPRLCTWLPGLRSSARHTLTHVDDCLFDYISTGRSMHCAFYHWRPHLSSDYCIGLEQFAGVSPVIAVIASFSQQTENRTFCLVLQL